MGDQDFNIKVVTTADTTGIQQVDAGLDSIARRQAEAEAKWARSPINPINQRAVGGGGIAALGGPASPSGSTAGEAGLTGTAVGIGTIISLLTAGINKWREFNDELDKQAQAMLKSQERAHALGLEIADMFDAMKSAERIDTDPLEMSFNRLKGDVRSLKTEMHIAFDTGAYEDAKKLATQLGVVESQLNRVTNAIAREADAAKKLKETQDKATEGAISEASPLVRGLIALEKTPGAEKAAENIQKSLNLEQKAELEEIRKRQSEAYRPPPKTTPFVQPVEEGSGGPSLKGEQAQQLREYEIQKTKDAAAAAKQEREESNAKLRGENRAGEIEKQTKDTDLTKAINDLAMKFDRYWS